MMYLRPGRRHNSKNITKEAVAKRNETLQEEEFQRFINNEAPSDVGNKDFQDFQAELASLGCVEVVTTCIDSENPLIVTATFQLAVTLLDGGNVQVQRLFEAVLTPASSAPFFARLHTIFIESQAAIKEQKRLLKEAETQQNALKKAGIEQMSNISSTNAARESLAKGQIQIFEVLKMMRRMCMGHYKELQDVLRRQPLNHTSIDFLSEAVAYLETLEPELNEALHQGDFKLVDGGVRGFLMLADAMHGPNIENQAAIADTGIFDLCDRIFARIRFDSDNDAGTLAKNLERSRLKKAVLTCLTAFLEGSKDDLIPNQMLALINWHGVASQMQSCYKFYNEALAAGRNLEDDKMKSFSSDCLEEGISYYFILVHIQNYDRTNEFIRPVLKSAQDDDAQMMHFYEQRKGYIEIVRHERLERVYFHLPSSCLPGGPMETDESVHTTLYRAARNDFDKKNQTFIENMCTLVERERYRNRIRKTSLAFTVTHWDRIRNINFQASFCLCRSRCCRRCMPCLHR
jgi:mevalonate kinase